MPEYDMYDCFTGDREVIREMRRLRERLDVATGALRRLAGLELPVSFPRRRWPNDLAREYAREVLDYLVRGQVGETPEAAWDRLTTI